MKRKFLVFVMLIVLTIFLMNAVSVYAGKVSLMMWGGAIEEKEMKGYLAAFNEEYPDIKVEIIRPADYWPKLMSMIAAGTPPDVFYMGFPEFVNYHEKGAILNLQSYINADPNFNELDFFPGLLAAFKDKNTGEIFGIPKDWSTYVVYYNKEMFKTAVKPGFLLLLFCMSLTASAELAPGQWLETTFKEYANASGTLILVYGSMIMFVLRFFAGPLAKAINPIGIMTLSTFMTSIGLFLLSKAAESEFQNKRFFFKHQRKRPCFPNLRREFQINRHLIANN